MGYFFQDKPLEEIKGYTKSILDEIEKAFLTNFDVDAIKLKLNKVEEGATEVAKVFGQGKEQITAIKAAMAEAVTSVTLLGGGFDKILEIQTQVSKVLGTNLILNSQSYEKLYATTKVTGVEANKLTEGFKDAGFSVYAIGDQMTKVMNTARAIGVNGQQVSTQVVENMSKMNQYNFQGGVEGMAKMAAQAVNLRTDMKLTLDIANRLFEPEKAIDMAAAMQRLGVAQGDLLDPLRLMDLAQNDPAELQNQIAEMSKSFTKLKADGTGFEILPGEKRRMMEISKELYGNTEQLGKMALAAADLDLKMSKIKFSDDVTDKETQNLIANMAEMGEGGEYKVTYTDAKGDAQTKNVTELDESDIKAITEASQKAPKTMEELAKGQLDTQTKIQKDIESIANRTGLGLAGTKAATMAEGAAREVSGALQKVPDSYSVKSVRENIGGGLDNFIKTVGDGKWGEAFLNAAAGTATYLETTLHESWVNTKTAIDELAESTNPLIQIMGDIVKKTGGAVAEHENIPPPRDFIKFPGKSFQPYPEDTIVGLTKGKEAMENLNSTNSNSVVGTSNIKMEDVKVNLSIDITGTDKMNPEDLKILFETNQTLKQSIVANVLKGLNGANGSNGSNPIVARKQMAKMANLG
jgi:hypothetical protein